MSACGLRAAADGPLSGSRRRRCSRSFTNSHRWWRGCRSTRHSSTSPPAGVCSAIRKRSAPRFAGGSARPRSSPRRSESDRTSWSPRSLPTSASPTGCSASATTICAACSTPCRSTGCSESAPNRSRGCRRPASGRSAMHAERAMPCCGAPSAAMGARFERSLRASTSGRSLRSARRNRSARRRRSEPTSRARRSSSGTLRRSPTAPRRACARTSSPPAESRLKIRRADFKTYTRQRALEPPTQDTAAVTAMALAAAARMAGRAS